MPEFPLASPLLFVAASVSAGIWTRPSRRLGNLVTLRAVLEHGVVVVTSVASAWVVTTAEDPQLAIVPVGALIIGVIIAAGYALTITGLLLILLPVTHLLNDPDAAFSLQQLWGVALLGCLLQLIATHSKGRAGFLILIAGVMTFIGALGALLGPVPGDALRAWFWIVLTVLVFLSARELAPHIPLGSAAVTMGTAAGVIVLLVLLNPYGSTETVDFVTGEVSQLSGGLTNPHTLAAVCLALLPWTFVLVFGFRSSVTQLTGVLLCLALGVIVILTTIRSAQVGFAIFLLGAVIAATRTYRERHSLWIPRAAVAGLIVLVTITTLSSSSVGLRWSEIGVRYQSEGAARAGSGRLFLWDQAIRNFEEAPVSNQLFGSGLRSSRIFTLNRIGTDYSAHSDAFELLVSAGVIGSAVIASLLVALSLKLARVPGLLRSRKMAWLGTLAIASACAFVASALLNGFFFYTSAAVPGMAFLGYALGLGRPPSQPPSE